MTAATCIATSTTSPLPGNRPSLTDLSYFSHTVGIGLRYPTPVGPVSLDFGYQLNPAQYQATNTQTNITQVFRLPHFQFSFNIGPVF